WTVLHLKQMQRELHGTLSSLLKTIFTQVYSQFIISIEVDDFVEILSELVQPLEDFFNEVFVMVVCCLRILLVSLIIYAS
ncbi:hypothetical protein SCA6_004486, partial [Theobroma cacao]